MIIQCQNLFLCSNVVNSVRFDFCTCSHAKKVIKVVLLSFSNQGIHQYKEIGNDLITEIDMQIALIACLCILT